MQDEFALASHQKALNAINQQNFEDEIIPIEVHHRKQNIEDNSLVDHKIIIDTDEGPRHDTSLKALQKLNPVFAKDGSVTAGNSSQVSDGAAIVILISETYLKQHNLTPLGKLIGFAVAGVPPKIMGIGPIKAIPKVLQQTGLNIDNRLD